MTCLPLLICSYYNLCHPALENVSLRETEVEITVVFLVSPRPGARQQLASPITTPRPRPRSSHPGPDLVALGCLSSSPRPGPGGASLRLLSSPRSSIRAPPSGGSGRLHQGASILGCSHCFISRSSPNPRFVRPRPAQVKQQHGTTSSPARHEIFSGTARHHLRHDTTSSPARHGTVSSPARHATPARMDELFNHRAMVLDLNCTPLEEMKMQVQIPMKMQV